jgi:hypothetical protein
MDIFKISWIVCQWLRLSTVLQACNTVAWSRSPICVQYLPKKLLWISKNMANCRATTCLFLFLIVMFLNPIGNNRNCFLNIINRNFAFYIFYKFFNDAFVRLLLLLLKEDEIRDIMALQVLSRSIWCCGYVFYNFFGISTPRDTG